MDHGNDFLKAQIHTVAAQHHGFLKALEDHEAQAEDARYRDLCTRYIPNMRDHQRMLEDYQSELGAPGAGVLRRVATAAAGLSRNLADTARESDYQRLLSDVAMSRQSEESFKIFRDAGRSLGLRHLAEIADACERDHDSYNRDAARLVQQMFVERARQPGLEAPAAGGPDARR